MPMSDCPAEYPLAGVESIDTDLLLFGSIFLTSLEVDHVKLSAQRNAGQLTICLVAVHRGYLWESNTGLSIHSQ